MFQREAATLAVRLAALTDDELTPLLNLGSSTEVFRTQTQPWIDRLLFKPLRDRGVEPVHVDLKDGAGVDVIADILTDEGYARLKALQPRTILMCNLLEHVLEPGLLVERAMSLLPVGGKLIMSGPRSYPYHRDPIDTMFRPTPEEVLELAPHARLIDGEILPMGYYWDDLKKRPWIILRQVVRAPFPFLGWTKWKRSMKKLYWLIKPYLVTIAVLEKTAQPLADGG